MTYAYAWHEPNLNCAKIGSGINPRARMLDYAKAHNLQFVAETLFMIKCQPRPRKVYTGSISAEDVARELEQSWKYDLRRLHVCAGSAKELYRLHAPFTEFVTRLRRKPYAVNHYAFGGMRIVR